VKGQLFQLTAGWRRDRRGGLKGESWLRPSATKTQSAAGDGGEEAAFPILLISISVVANLLLSANNGPSAAGEGGITADSAIWPAWRRHEIVSCGPTQLTAPQHQAAVISEERSISATLTQ